MGIDGGTGRGVEGMEFRIGERGILRVLETMGDETSIVEAARVSYGKGTRKSSDDAKLIRYLWRHGHTSPFEMCEIKFFVKAPMDVWRQWVRHRTASINEYSTRYSEVEMEFEAVNGKWRRQSSRNRQGSDGMLVGDRFDDLTARERDLYARAWRLYEDGLAAGVAREQIRRVLPLCTYTTAYWKCDLRNVFHFLSLRLADTAQTEIREYAKSMAEAIKVWVPNAWAAFEEYTLNAVRFSGTEVELVGLLLRGDRDGFWNRLVALGWADSEKRGWSDDRLALEFSEKLNKMADVSLFAI